MNPRYPFGLYTISNRARSASYATSPSGFCAWLRCQLGYNTLYSSKCQHLFSVFKIYFLHPLNAPVTVDFASELMRKAGCDSIFCLIAAVKMGFYTFQRTFAGFSPLNWLFRHFRAYKNPLRPLKNHLERCMVDTQKEPYQRNADKKGVIA